MGFIQRRLLKAVLAIVTHPRLTLLISGLSLLICAGVALRYLGVDTDQDRLFSPNVPFFRNYLEYERKFPENEAAYIIIEPKDVAHPPSTARWTALADRLHDSLVEMKQYVERAQVRTSRQELGQWALLFDDASDLPGDFSDLRDEVTPLARVWGESPNALEKLVAPTPMQRFIVYCGSNAGDARVGPFIRALADSWTASVRHPETQPSIPDPQAVFASDPRALGYSYVPDDSNKSNHILLIGVYLTDTKTLAEGVAQVQAITDLARAEEKDFPEFLIGVTGRPVLDADEMRTSDHDSTIAEVIAMIVIFAGLALTLRSIWLATVAEISLAVAIGWTFGWATISVGQLNLLSLVFLITLIGIGMDYLVQILTRYRREARRYIRPTAVWARVFRSVSPPIFTACLGASGAFVVSIFTDFKGAAELGIIASGGLLLCLLSGYTVLPAILVLFPPKLELIDPEQRYARLSRPASPLRRLGPPALWVIGLCIAANFISRTTFNPNLLDMQNQKLASVQLIHKLQTWSGVVVSQDLHQLRAAQTVLKGSPEVASTESILGAYDNYAWIRAHQDEVPRLNWVENVQSVAQEDVPRMRQAALTLASKLKDKSATSALTTFAVELQKQPTAQSAAALSRWQEGFVLQLKSLMALLSPPPLMESQLPPILRDHLISTVDAGKPSYALYIYPSHDLWQREPLAAFVKDIEQRVASSGASAPAVTGIASEIFHSTDVIKHSFYRATAYALGLVFVLVFLDLRSFSQTLVTVSVLGLGLPMLVGLMGLFHVDWNFANFFGLPILIGAGHEYGVFMMHRYREVCENPRRVWGRWDVSDRALLLCAFVTSSSFTFFWLLGNHEGLKSLGLVMALGTTCIYLAAVLVVRPLLKWHLERLHTHSRELQRRVETDR